MTPASATAPAASPTAPAAPGPNTTHAPADSPPAEPTPALAVLGIGRDGRPRAAWFPTPDVTRATKAAEAMGMRAVVLCDDAQRRQVGELPPGRVFASGRAFVPFVARATFDRLCALLGGARGAADPGDEAVAQSPGVAAPGGGDGPGGRPPVDPRYPRSWAGVALGSLVLITEGEQDGWYEAVVVASQPGGEFTLQWRDWPDLPLLVRRRDAMALLHPNGAAAAGA